MLALPRAIARPLPNILPSDPALVAALALLALAASFGYLAAAPGPTLLFDDSFISLTYARNLAATGILTFDGEHWSTGATSVLHVGLIALLIRLGIEPVAASIATGIAAHMALPAVTYWLAIRLFGSRVAAVTAGLLIATTGYAVLDANGGLETSLFMTLGTATLASVLTWRTVGGSLITGLLAALTILTRPEGLALLPALLLYMGLTERHRPVRELLARAAALAGPALLAVAALVALHWAVTGIPTPGTGTVKLRFFQEYALPWTAKLEMSAGAIGRFLTPVAPMAVLALAGFWRRPALLLLLYWLPVIAAYAVLFPGGLDHYFYRYQHPALPLMAVLAGGGVALAFRQMATMAPLRRWLTAAVLALALAAMGQHYDQWRGVYRESLTDSLILSQMALELNEVIEPGQRLATHDIGVAGYFGHYEVVDLVGLANPEVVPYHNDRRVVAYLEQTDAEFLLLFQSWDELFLQIGTDDQPGRFELLRIFPRVNEYREPYRLYHVRRAEG